MKFNKVKGKVNNNNLSFTEKSTKFTPTANGEINPQHPLRQMEEEQG